MSDAFFSWFGFFAHGLGLLAIAGIAGLIVLLWNWQITLVGLVLIQLGVAALVTLVYGYAAQWMAVQLTVIGLGAVILALSAYQARPILQASRPGNWLFRGAAITLITAGWWLFDIVVTMPTIDQPTMDLFTWLVLCALLLLGMSQSSFYTAAALLLWCVVVQALTAIFLDIPSIGVLIGMLELLIALACSYLILVEPGQVLARAPAPTDTSSSVPEHRLQLGVTSPHTGQRSLPPSALRALPAPVDSQPADKPMIAGGPG